MSKESYPGAEEARKPIHSGLDILDIARKRSRPYRSQGEASTNHLGGVLPQVNSALVKAMVDSEAPIDFNRNAIGRGLTTPVLSFASMADDDWPAMYEPTVRWRDFPSGRDFTESIKKRLVAACKLGQQSGRKLVVVGYTTRGHVYNVTSAKKD